MNMDARFRQFARRVARLGRNTRGIAAVEFALVLPIMVLLDIGCVEVTQALTLQRRLNLIAAAVVNLTGQATTIASTDMTNILNASTAIIAPYSSSGLTVKVSCLSIDGSGVAKVAWSAALNATARSVGSTVTIPAALAIANSQQLYSEVSYPYAPQLGYFITGTLTLSDRMYQSPRTTAPTYVSTSCP